jgi:hypothetical protein
VLDDFDVAAAANVWNRFLIASSASSRSDATLSRSSSICWFQFQPLFYCKPVWPVPAPMYLTTTNESDANDSDTHHTPLFTVKLQTPISTVRTTHTTHYTEMWTFALPIYWIRTCTVRVLVTQSFRYKYLYDNDPISYDKVLSLAKYDSSTDTRDSHGRHRNLMGESTIEQAWQGRFGRPWQTQDNDRITCVQVLHLSSLRAHDPECSKSHGSERDGQFL